MVFLEDMDKRVKRFGIIDMKLAQGPHVFCSCHSQTNTSNNEHKHMVVCSLISAVCDRTILCVLD